MAYRIYRLSLQDSSKIHRKVGILSKPSVFQQVFEYLLYMPFVFTVQ